MMSDALYADRIAYVPPLPEILHDVNSALFSRLEKCPIVDELREIAPLFPHTFGRARVTLTQGEPEREALKIGVLFSGGQAPGGHSVLAGIFDAIQKVNPESELIGFLGGPSGFLEDAHILLTEEVIAKYRHTGGFDCIGSGRTKIESEEQFQKAVSVASRHQLNGLIIIGGDDSNTNAAILAEYFVEHGVKTSVVGVPKTIDGDLQCEDVAISFGFDTATKVYAEMIGNIAKDALSAKKYYHFVKLMGRSASHVTLECALKVHPNAALISEEVEQARFRLSDIVAFLTDLVEKRGEMGKHYGIVLIPEGLLESIPEVKKLISSLNAHLANLSPEEALEKLTEEEKGVFFLFPEEIGKQLLLERDPHGNVQVSHIATEVLMSTLVKRELEKRGREIPFTPVHHFLGYEGRSGYPSLFDTSYCYALGAAAALLVRDGHTGYMAAASGLIKPVATWEVRGVPITSLFAFEERKGKMRPVIKKTLVSLRKAPFIAFSEQRGKWMYEDSYQVPGPIQFYGPDALTWSVPLTL